MKKLGREQSMMSLECFKTYIDPHIPYLFEVYLHNWGESLLNKDTYGMIEYAQSCNIGTNLSSNLNILQSDDLDRIIESGLEYLVVSLDGASAETYRQYRVRGDFDLVVHNMTELIRRRNARGKPTPVVEWQFIVMRHNQHEVEQAEDMAKRFGVDLIRFIPVGLPYDARNRAALQEKWFPTRFEGRVTTEKDGQTFGQGSKPGPCFYLYRSMTVNADGGVSPCCVVYQKDRDFADLSQIEDKADVMAIYNNERFQWARSLFTHRAAEKQIATVCDGCDIFAVHPSKRRVVKTTVPVAIRVDGKAAEPSPAPPVGAAE